MMNAADTPPRHFTDREIAAANDTDLPELLARLGYHVKRVGSYYTTKEMDSLRIKNRRTWYRYSESLGGDAITFLRHFQDMPFRKAVEFLLKFNGFSDIPPVSRPVPRAKPPPEKPPFALPAAGKNNQRVCAYLRGRGISPDIIDSFIKSRLLYESARHHDCIFVGYDQAGKAAFAARRSTDDGRPFRGDVCGSSKKIAFRLPCVPELSTVYVFEAPIDLMSWFTLYPSPVSNAVALCGLYDGPLETYLSENPCIKEITLCLDADKWGRKTATALRIKYQARGYKTKACFPSSGKDWNEYLQDLDREAG